MSNADRHLAFLGFPVRDRVTGFSGTVSSVCFDLYGCIQYAVHPPAADGKLGDGQWFDEKRIEKTGKEPVMNQPTFDVVPGPAAKPSTRAMSVR